MTKNRSLSQFPPLVFNVFKPARMTSYDVIRHFKRHLPSGYGKIGHFGTLDPFASGVLMIGIGGAARLNDYIHELLPKTYLATGKLGIETPTGDYESEISQRDDSVYLKTQIANFPKEFIEERLRLKFLGEYWQAPHKYSASKFMGKNMHEWAREGVEIHKEPVLRHVYDIQVVRYVFPYLSVRVTVSSGTYVRTLFSHMAQELGTLGSLISLVREKIGPCTNHNAIKMKEWPKDKQDFIIPRGTPIEELLPFDLVTLDQEQEKKFKNGAFFKHHEISNRLERKFNQEYFWMRNENEQVLGLAHKFDDVFIKPKILFQSEGQADL